MVSVPLGVLRQYLRGAKDRERGNHSMRANGRHRLPQRRRLAVRSAEDGQPLLAAHHQALRPARRYLYLQETLCIQSIRDAVTGPFNRHYLEPEPRGSTRTSCSVNWGFKLLILGNKWSITPF